MPLINNWTLVGAWINQMLGRKALVTSPPAHDRAGKMWGKGREERQGGRCRGRGGEISPNLSRAQANTGEHSGFRRQAGDLIDTQCETREVGQLAPSRYFIAALWLRSDGERCMSTRHNLGAAAASEKLASGPALVFVQGLPLSDSIAAFLRLVTHSHAAGALMTWHKVSRKDIWSALWWVRGCRPTLPQVALKL